MPDCGGSNRNWTGEERREFCKLCKSDSDLRSNTACSKSKTAMWVSVTFAVVLVPICFGLSAIAWSAKSDVANQKETVQEIAKEQKEMAKNLNTIAEFVKLLKEGSLMLPTRHDSDEEHN